MQCFAVLSRPASNAPQLDHRALNGIYRLQCESLLQHVVAEFGTGKQHMLGQWAVHDRPAHKGGLAAHCFAREVVKLPEAASWLLWRVPAGPGVFEVLGEKMRVSAGALEARALALAAEAAGLAPSQREPLWQDKQE